MATQYAFGQIATNGLVLSLDAADKNSYIGSGTVWNDLSGNGYSGSLINTPTFNSANGGSIVFNGTNQYISTPLNIDANPNTIGAWCYPTAITSTAGYGIVLTDNGGWDKGFEINNSLWQIHTGNNLASTGVLARVNIWQFACISYTNSATKFYVDGRLIYTGAAPAATAGSNVEIGRANYLGGAGSRWFVGRISSVQIYNRELSEAEVLNNFNAVKSRFGL